MVSASRPSLVFAKALELHREGVLLSNLGVTAAETPIGLAAGCVIGVAMGIAVGIARPVRELFEPFSAGRHAFPNIAMAPLQGRSDPFV
jgi:ABC-type nitrate/sulfonate/bicarbonate transport system permease component